MICKKCNTNNDEGSTFCIHCGERLADQQSEKNAVTIASASTQESSSVASDSNMSSTDSNTPPITGAPVAPNIKNKSNSQKMKLPIKKIIIAGAAAIAVIIALVVVVKIVNSPEKKLNEALEAGDLEHACSIFDENFMPEDLTDETIALLEGAVTKARDDFLAGTITADEFEEKLQYVDWFGCTQLTGVIEDAMESAENHSIVLSHIENAESYMQQQSYLNAMSSYEKALQLEEGNATAKSGYESAKSAYCNEIIAEAQKLAANDDIDGAVRVLDDAVNNYLPGDEALLEAKDSILNARITEAMNNAQMTADSGDWDGALAMIDEYIEEYGESESLSAKREEILNKMPVTLNNIAVVNSEGLKELEGIVRDRWGNRYNYGVEFEPHEYHMNVNDYVERFGLYSLNGKYTTFSGTFFPAEDASDNCEIIVTITADGEEIYKVSGINSETSPVKFSLDVTGKQSVRIVVRNEVAEEAMNVDGHIVFADTLFSNAKPAETTTAAETTTKASE